MPLRVFLGDTLYRIDIEGVKPPRMFMRKMGCLTSSNSVGRFALAARCGSGPVVKVDVDKPELTVVADASRRPAAVHFDSTGICGSLTPQPASWVSAIRNRPAKKMVAQRSTSLDNLAIDDNDRYLRHSTWRQWESRR